MLLAVDKLHVMAQANHFSRKRRFLSRSTCKLRTGLVRFRKHSVGHTSIGMAGTAWVSGMQHRVISKASARLAWERQGGILSFIALMHGVIVFGTMFSIMTCHTWQTYWNFLPSLLVEVFAVYVSSAISFTLACPMSLKWSCMPILLWPSNACHLFGYHADTTCNDCTWCEWGHRLSKELSAGLPKTPCHLKTAPTTL